jgi:2,4-dienoyl-CoA reductase-like NADH-dependent reductase (Old Yellow Enzyme family)
VPYLFDEFKLRGLTFRNRIGVSPMCQYSSEDGFANDWHLVHLGSRAVGGAGLVIMEDTAVLPDGRITYGDHGLWSDAHIEPLQRITRFLRAYGTVPAIQLGYAGRKGSTTIPWQGGHPKGEGRSLTPEEGAWEICAPTAEPYGGDRTQIPHEMTREEIVRVQKAFGDAASRAEAAGFEMVELHAAWGYIFHQFYSPISNKRTDDYGGSFENRIRFTLETVREVRQYWSDNKPLAIRLACTDWVDGGWTLDETVELAKRLKAEGVDLIDCTSWAIAPIGDVPWGRGFQVPFSEQIRQEAKIATTAVGFITEPSHAEEIISEGKADIVLLAREMLRNPYWSITAAQALGQDDKVMFPSPYEHWLTGRSPKPYVM